MPTTRLLKIMRRISRISNTDKAGNKITHTIIMIRTDTRILETMNMVGVIIMKGLTGMIATTVMIDFQDQGVSMNAAGRAVHMKIVVAVAPNITEEDINKDE